MTLEETVIIALISSLLPQAITIQWLILEGSKANSN
jgi:hypothetical protein